MTVVSSTCRDARRTAPPPASPCQPGRTNALFVVVPLVLGFLPAALTFSLNPNAAADIGLNQVPLPAWVFVAVWLVIYPGMGLAARRLWRQRSNADVCVPLAVLALGFLYTTVFWLTDSLRTTAILDGFGVAMAATTTWVVAHHNSTAARWLLPWLLWMPTTLILKLAVLANLS